MIMKMKMRAIVIILTTVMIVVLRTVCSAELIVDCPYATACAASLLAPIEQEK